jgi:hypothetical protein
LFDGGLQPAYAYASAPVQGRFSLSNRPAFQLNTFQETASGTGGVQAEPPAPVPDNNAVLKSQIAAEENRLKTISFIIKNMGVYKTVQDVIVDLKKDPASVDSEALVNLAMTAQSAVADASLLPEMDKITSQDLSSAEVKANVMELFETGQTTVQDIQDMSSAAGEIAKALSENKASTQDAAQWKTLTSDLQNFASALKEKIGKLNPPSQTAILAPKQTTPPPHSSNSDINRIIFGVSWLVLMVAASHIAPLAVVGVIIGAGIGAAMTPKGQDASGNMFLGMLLGMGIGAMFAPAAAHAAILAAAHAAPAAAVTVYQASLDLFSRGFFALLGAFGGAVAGGIFGGVVRSAVEEVRVELGYNQHPWVGGGIISGGILGAVLGAVGAYGLEALPMAVASSMIGIASVGGVIFGAIAGAFMRTTNDRGWFRLGPTLLSALIGIVPGGIVGTITGALSVALFFPPAALATALPLLAMGVFTASLYIVMSSTPHGRFGGTSRAWSFGQWKDWFRFKKSIVSAPSPESSHAEGLSEELYKAMVDHDVDKVRLLIQQGVDVNAPISYGPMPPPVTSAVDLLVDPDILTALIQAGADVNVQDAKYESTALMQVAQGGDAEVFRVINAKLMRVLLDAHAKVDLQGKGGLTALMIAVEGNFEDGVQMLLQAHADVNLTEGYGRTALDFALRPGYPIYSPNESIVSMLKEAGAKTGPNAQWPTNTGDE